MAMSNQNDAETSELSVVAAWQINIWPRNAMPVQPHRKLICCAIKSPFDVRRNLSFYLPGKFQSLLHLRRGIDSTCIFAIWMVHRHSQQSGRAE